MHYSKTVAATLIALLPSTAFANWSGSYVGLSYGQASEAELTFDRETGVDDDYTFEESTPMGGFFGTRAQNGSMAYGFEAEMLFTDAAPNQSVALNLDYLFDVKATAGYAVNDALIYGILSVSSSKVANNTAGDDVNGVGFGLGAGVAYKISPSFSISAEYLARSMKSDMIDTRGPIDVDVEARTKVDTATVRAAYHF